MDQRLHPLILRTLLGLVLIFIALPIHFASAQPTPGPLPPGPPPPGPEETHQRPQVCPPIPPPPQPHCPPGPPPKEGKEGKMKNKPPGDLPRENWNNLSEAERKELLERRKAMREEMHRRVEEVLRDLGLTPENPNWEKLKRTYLEERKQIERGIFAEMQKLRAQREGELIEKLRREISSGAAQAEPTQSAPSSSPSND